MNAMRRKTGGRAVAALVCSLVLAACGDGPAPAEEASALAAGAAAVQPGSTVALARMPAASAGHAGAGPAPTRRASDAAAGGVCPSTAGEPAPRDGGRDVTQASEPIGQETEPVLVPPPPTVNPG